MMRFFRGETNFGETFYGEMYKVSKFVGNVIELVDESHEINHIEYTYSIKRSIVLPDTIVEMDLLENAFNDAEHYQRLFAIAVKSLTKLDDYFEYRNESKIDRHFVNTELDVFNNAIAQEMSKEVNERE